jgi:hypothetical protein
MDAMPGARELRSSLRRDAALLWRNVGAESARSPHFDLTLPVARDCAAPSPLAHRLRGDLQNPCERGASPEIVNRVGGSHGRVDVAYG